MLPPADVLATGRRMARAVGIDEPDGESFAAEAWGTHEHPLWITVAHRRCIDERRRLSGRGGPERRALTVLDATAHFGSEQTVGEILLRADDGGFDEVETRVDLAATIGGLSDASLATLARVYWLGMTFEKVGPTDVARAMREARTGPPKPRPKARPKRPKPEPPLLTPRQTDVIAHAAQGMTNEAIAEALSVSVNTVKTTMQNALARIDAHDRAHVVAIAVRAGWI